MSMFGWIFIAALLWALVTGSANLGSRRVLRREQPLAYWAVVLTLGVVAGLLFAWGPVR